MENKLGLDEWKLEEVERKIVSLKLNLLDDLYTFNEDAFNPSYLLKLNEFLFGDVHDDIGYRTKEHSGIISSYLGRIIDICIEKNKQELLKALEEMWSIQPFKYGNTRTLIAFVKILDKAYDLGINVDVNSDFEVNGIESIIHSK